MSKRKSYKIPEAQLNLFDLSHPVMPVLDVSRCEARLINHETAARMVETYHYAHRVPSIVVAVGMFVDEVLAGVCTYGIPPAPEVQGACGEEYKQNTIELNRLFVFDEVGKNGESWLIGQSFKLMPNNYFVLISYADKGQNHTGYIYQATNWLYTGLSSPGGTSSEMLINGKRISGKGCFNIYGTQSIGQLSDMGLVVTREKRTIKHRYVYFLGNKRQRKELRKALKWPVLPYPKNVASLPANTL